VIATLAIKNYALIEDLRVDLKEGLTVITGETGAGKSIILGAMGLLLGKRANLDSLKDPEVKCVIEGHFQIASYDLQGLFEENDLDYDEHTIIRREILPGGKSRAFVNDTPVTLAQIQAVAPFLVDIHSQHETLEISSEEYQLEVLDALAANELILKEYKLQLQTLLETKKQLAQLKSKKEEHIKELDYNQFLLNELEQAQLATLNQEELEESLNTLSNAESIRESFSEILQRLTEEQVGVIEGAKQARSVLSRIQSFSTEYENYWERLNSAIIELEDLSDEIGLKADTISADPEELARVNDRLQTLYKLQQKHGLTTVDELRVLELELAEKVSATLEIDDKIEAFENKVALLSEQLQTIGENISENREKVIPIFTEQLETILGTLGLPNAQFTLNLETSDDFRHNGTDVLELLFSANKGVRPGPIGKVASGGEMSRIMLAVKSVLAKYKKLPTLVFDEIDTGVSGEIANKMADIMVAMGAFMQVLTITHLPQVAAKGKQHLKVYKEDFQQITSTHLTPLTREERVMEIAEMLGGKKISEAAMANAKELLN